MCFFNSRVGNFAGKNQKDDIAPFFNRHFEKLPITCFFHRTQSLLIQHFVAAPQVNGEDAFGAQAGKEQAVQLGIEECRSHGAGTEDVEKSEVIPVSRIGLQKRESVLVDDAHSFAKRKSEITMSQFDHQSFLFHRIDPGLGVVVKEEMRQSTATQANEQDFFGTGWRSKAIAIHWV